MNRRTALSLMFSGTVAATSGAVISNKAGAASGKDQAARDVVGMLYDATLCIGCKACMVACTTANNLMPDVGSSQGLYQAPDTLNASTKTIIKLYKGHDEQSFMKAQCMHCIDPACVSACMMHALKKDKNGIVYWDGSSCVGCRYCQIGCPYSVPKFEWTSNNPRIVKCEMCRHLLAKGGIPACVDVCPREAIIFGKRTNLLKVAHDRMEANPDRYLPKIYGEYDGGGTQVLYLSHVEFEKLGLPVLGERPVPEPVREVQGTIYNYFAAPIALYCVLARVIKRNIGEADAEAAESKVGEDQP